MASGGGMTDAELRDELNGLGIHEEDGSLVLLLPLLQVAWADGEIQAEERARVLQIAQDHGWVAPSTAPLLEGWLTFRPSLGYFGKANAVLRGLLGRAHGLPTRIEPQALLSLCETVAEAAGGILGFGAIERREKGVLTELADALHVGTVLIDLNEDALSDGWFDADVTDLSGFVVTAGAPPVRGPEDGPMLQVVGRPDLDLRLHKSAVGVGRQGSNDLQLRGDSTVSRCHCQIHLQSGVWSITDSGSSHGTWVEGERILSRPLFGDEMIQIGEFQIRFRV